MTTPFPVLLQDRFAAAMLGVCEEAGVQSTRERLMAPLLALLCRRLYRVMAQVSRALARMQAGRLPARRGAGASRDTAMREPGGRNARPSDGLRLRYGWAWLIRMAPRAAQYAPQIQGLLDEPEMQAALAASPSLRRAVRPLCRGLAFPTPSVLVETRRRRVQTRDAVPSAADGGVSEAEEGVPQRVGLPPRPDAPRIDAPRIDPSGWPPRPAPADNRGRAAVSPRLFRLFIR